MSESFNKLHGKGQRILLVEDESSVLRFTQSALLRNGYTVFTAESGEEAQKIFEKEKGFFHLILSDVELPDKTGFELASAFHSKNPMLNIIISSGYGDNELRDQVIQDKRFRFLQKPYNLDELLSTVNECTGSE